VTRSVAFDPPADQCHGPDKEAKTTRHLLSCRESLCPIKPSTSSVSMTVRSPSSDVSPHPKYLIRGRRTPIAASAVVA
jgi:hypothetical protein